MRTRHIKSSSDPALSNAEGARTGGHTPVLLHEVLRELAVQSGDVVLDATLGGAGHAQKLVESLGPQGMFIGLDADAAAVARAQEKLPGAKAAINLVHANFRTLKDIARDLNVPAINKALFDLGWSGYQLTSGRGFSFLADEPLLMTYGDTEGGLTAQQVVNEWEESSLADIIWGFGEERYARKIARAIVQTRAHKPIETSLQLGEIVKHAVPPGARHGKTHPATKTFQALRIVVNDEFGAIEEGISAAWNLLRNGGRIAVITFHSTEDRVVKRLFKRFVESGEGTLVHKHVIVASREETIANPRSRSAKLRVIEKTVSIQ